jgi:hypothetical protein
MVEQRETLARKPTRSVTVPAGGRRYGREQCVVESFGLTREVIDGVCGFVHHPACFPPAVGHADRELKGSGPAAT